MSGNYLTKNVGPIKNGPLMTSLWLEDLEAGLTTNGECARDGLRGWSTRRWLRMVANSCASDERTNGRLIERLYTPLWTRWRIMLATATIVTIRTTRRWAKAIVHGDLIRTRLSARMEHFEVSANVCNTTWLRCTPLPTLTSVMPQFARNSRRVLETLAHLEMSS